MSLDAARESFDAPSTSESIKNTSDQDHTAPAQHVTEPTPAAVASPVASEETKARIGRVLQSDIGINTLLTRLKQSISSAKDYSSFLKERAILEEKHANGLKKLSRSTYDLIRRPENRQGGFANQYEESTSVQDRMADNGMDFAQNLHVMSEELQDLAAHAERGRKQWKHTGLDAESRAQNAEAAMEKAKNRYHTAAEQYDRVRTGERQGGKFGLKGPKSAAQQEEQLLTKAQNADAEYSDKVQEARSQREQLLSNDRPQAVRELQNLVLECDAGLSMQIQKFAVLNEKLLLNNGLCVSPLNSAASGASSKSRSLREIAASVNNQQDFDEFVLGHANHVGPPPAEIKYEKHPALVTPFSAYQTSQPPPHSQGPYGVNTPERRDTGGFSGPQGQPSNITQSPPAPQMGQFHSNQGSPAAAHLPPGSNLGGTGRSSLESGGRANGSNSGRPAEDYRNVSGPMQHRPGQSSYPGSPSQPQQSQGPGYHQRYASGSMQGRDPHGPGPNQAYDIYGAGPGRGQPVPSAGPYSGPQGDRYPTTNRPEEYAASGPGSQGAGYPHYPPDGRGFPNISGQNGSSRQNLNEGQGSGNGGPVSQPRNGRERSNLPPLKPVFGVSLDDLYKRDNSAVPAIVHQCIQAVDLFGLHTEGIYRTSGSVQHIQELRSLFDHDSFQVDFRDPANFFNDIAAVTTLLKHFLKDLRDPLLTSSEYRQFIKAAQQDEEVVRRDSLHAIINSLPDPNYATLRSIVLHLNRVVQHSQQNRMTASNLAIIFGPTLMGGPPGGHPGADVADAGWQARVVETILAHTLEIFDDDE